MNSVPDYKPQEQKTYKGITVLYAVISIVLGFLFSKLIIIMECGFSTFTFFTLFLIATVILTIVKKQKLTVFQIAHLVFNFLLSCTLFIYDDINMRELVVVFEVFSYFYWYISAYGNRLGKKPDREFFLDMLKGSVVMPLSGIVDFFPSLAQNIKKTSSGKKILYAFLGILLAIVPTAIVTVLLNEADVAFANLIDNLFSDIWDSLFKNIKTFIIGIPCCLMIFGTVYSNLEHDHNTSLPKETRENFRKKVSFANQIMVAAFIIPLCIVYMLFFFSQLGYYFSAFADILPEGYTYAEYAREGFFELCTVSFINAALIVVTSLFVKKTDGERPLSHRILSVIVCLFTLVLLATAFRKMILYISAYGLTRKRLYTSVFMAFLAIAFIFIIIKQFAKKFNVCGFIIVTAVVFFSVYAACNTDDIILKYNYDLYISGQTKTFDVDSLDNLSVVSVKYAIKLADGEDKKDETVSRKAKVYLYKKYNSCVENADPRILSSNLTLENAKKLLKEYRDKDPEAFDGIKQYITEPLRIYADYEPVN